RYRPEGTFGATEHSLATLEKARATGQILEAKAILCDSSHNLVVDLGDLRGVIPRGEAALGIREGTVKDIAILSRVNKSVCFKVTDLLRRDQVFHCCDRSESFRPGTLSDPVALLSRRAAQQQAQEELLSRVRPGDVLDARITHLESFGAFADIGCGIVGLISIENISVSRISHPSDRFVRDQAVKVVVKEIDREKKRFVLSHKELLGTWEENASRFEIGQTVCGVVRSVEEYGIFIELAPNLAGLAEGREGVRPGQQATVYIKNIIPEKMKVKLSLIDAFDGERKESLHYFFDQPHMDRFVYSPEGAYRQIETIFT
ncbi:MAG: 30S ribosomal protein S1, partial [Clostridia bacterium]|nr:30S ribosomal protein S1 [Clostridia bacterium]